MASAAGGKKGKRKKGVSLDLNVFLQNEKGAADGKAIVITKTGGSSWADTRDDFDTEPEKTVVLPTAPSSVRGGMNVDIDRIPVNGPYKVFLANVSYDADEDMISAMFQGLDVVSVHLPSDSTGRFRGFGYVEFSNREDLIEALQMDDLEVGGRKLRIDLKTPSERDQRGFSSSYRTDGDPDRAESDWRSGPRTEPARQERDWRSGGPSRDGPDRGGDRGGDSDWRSGGPSRDAPDRGGDRGGDSDWRSGPRSDNRGGFGGDFDRDRGGYGGFGGRGDRDQAPTMASRPGSKYEAVPSFSDYGRGGDRGGGGGGYGYGDRRGDDRYGSRDDRYGDRDRGGGGYGYDRRGDDRYGSRDDRYGDRDRGGGGYGYDRRRDDRCGSRDDRYGDRDRGGGGFGYDRRGDDRYGDRDRGGGGGGGGGFGYDRRGDDRFGDRGRDDRDGPRYGSSDGPRDSRDGPRYESRDGPRGDSRDGPRYESRDGPRSDSRDGPRYGGRDGPDSAEGSTADGDRAAPARPKLNLKPRSVPAEEIGKPAASSSIFGGARPVDTTAREREVEERLKGLSTERPRPPPPADGPPTGSQRRAEASRDIRYADGPPPKPRADQDDQAASSGETNGKAEGAEGRAPSGRAPRPPKVLDEKPAEFAQPTMYSALAEEDD